MGWLSSFRGLGEAIFKLPPDKAADFVSPASPQFHALHRDMNITETNDWSNPPTNCTTTLSNHLVHLPRRPQVPHFTSQHQIETSQISPSQIKSSHKLKSSDSSHKSSFAILDAQAGTSKLVTSGPIARWNPESGARFPQAWPSALEPCEKEPNPEASEGSIPTARDGVWCDSPKHPMNSVCVRELPPDFCPSVRPRTTFLNSKWQPAFIRTDCIGLDPQTFKKRKGVCMIPGDAKSPKDQGKDPNILVDYGDECCLSKPYTADENATGVKSAAMNNDATWKMTTAMHTQCEQHWGRSYCISPTAYERYMDNHPGGLQIDCSATSAARVGRIGAICQNQDRAELLSYMDKQVDGEAQRAHLAKGMTNLGTPDEPVKFTQESEDKFKADDPKCAASAGVKSATPGDPQRDAVAEKGKMCATEAKMMPKEITAYEFYPKPQPKPRFGAPGGSWPALDAPDPNVRGGGLGVHNKKVQGTRALVLPGSEFGVYGGEAVGSLPTSDASGGRHFAPQDPAFLVGNTQLPVQNLVRGAERGFL